MFHQKYNVQLRIRKAWISFSSSAFIASSIALMLTPPCLDSWAQKYLENLVEPVPSAVHQATWIWKCYLVLIHCFNLMRKSATQDDHILIMSILLICLLTPHDLKLETCPLSIPHLPAFLSSATVKHQDFVNVLFVVLKKTTRWNHYFSHSLFSKQSLFYFQ